MRTSAEAALPFVAWARVFSPLASEAERDEAWRALDLPGGWSACESEFVGTFWFGLPGPPVPLLLHAALSREGGAVREDWMRVIGHLDLRWTDHVLPPDHLGADCEVLARAIEREETVLIRELVKRYLEPWCAVARARLAGRTDAVAQLPEYFARDLAAL